MRSVRRASAACAATLPLAVVLTGCVSTQQIAARARLVSARVLAGQNVTEVVSANPGVTVGHVGLIQSRMGTAIVVPLRNNSSRTLTDLPISVGFHTAGEDRLYLNRAANLDYFENHVAAIGPHADSTWVFTTDRRVREGRPFATVGLAQLHPAAGEDLPRIGVSLRAGGSAPAGRTVEVSVSNRSGIPQYGLQVYVVAVRAGRDLGAGRAEVTHLGTHATATLSVALFGVAGRAALRLIAVPTIFS